MAKKNKSLLIVIDTNLWISFLISKKFNLLDKVLITHKVKLVFSAELITEIEQTIQKPKLRKYFPPEAMHEMPAVFNPYIDLIEVKYKTAKSRDPKDNFLLEQLKNPQQIFY